MLTFFTTAKPFVGHNGIIQRNALKSWTLLPGGVEVILFGDDEGAESIAHELGLRHERHVDRNEFGTKRLDTMFYRAQEIARNDLLCYINCDILLTQDFCAAVESVRTSHARFLMVGRRWDTEIRDSWNFDAEDWQARLHEKVTREGRRRGPEWIDYFVFPRGLYGRDLPPFVVGRVFWDNWLVWKALASRHAVVDVSSVFVAVHQNHDYGYHALGKSGVFCGSEAGRNYELAGGWRNLRTIADATEVLLDKGLRPNPARYWSEVKRYARQAARVAFHDGIERAWFFLLGLTRPLRRRLGLRAKNVRRWRGKFQLASGRDR
jgi:hypothetical protein